MKLGTIGFYTLSDTRCQQVSETSPMKRCELILTDRCNFKCSYCRGLREDCRGDMGVRSAMTVLNHWCAQGLENVRFSGGEPLLLPHLLESLATHAACSGVKRIAVSTNGSFPLRRYVSLVDAGVNDFSISLDACCAGDCEKMAGTKVSAFAAIVKNIRELSKITYVTVGVVLTDQNASNLANIVKFASSLGVSDIRIIPAAQEGSMIKGCETLDPCIVEKHPILAYRVRNIMQGRPVRGIQEYDSHRCYLPLDDSVVAGGFHFPCVIYMREQGDPIGRVGPNMREARVAWAEKHSSFDDPICRKNCLDVCVEHNNRCAAHHHTWKG